MRIAILGNSGSGKSTLAAALVAAYGMPCLDLDTVAWEPDQPALARDETVALDLVHSFCRRAGSWVVEGCYTMLIDAALIHTPTLLFLNPGLDTCLANCRARPWEPHKYSSIREQDANLPFLLSWVSDYYTRKGPQSLAAHRACFESYAGPKREIPWQASVFELTSELLASAS